MRTFNVTGRRLLALVLAMALMFSSVTVAGAESFDSGAAGYSSTDEAFDAGESSSDDIGGDANSEQGQEPEAQEAPDD